MESTRLLKAFVEKPSVESVEKQTQPPQPSYCSMLTVLTHVKSQATDSAVSSMEAQVGSFILFHLFHALLNLRTPFVKWYYRKVYFFALSCTLLLSLFANGNLRLQTC